MDEDSAVSAGLFDPACYPHPVEQVELVETHISRVFLAGEYAYKIKKPVRLPFLDFSQLDARRAFCEQELRLNRRTAPDLYLGVVPVSGTPEHPRIGASGQAFEYALKMRRFDQSGLADSIARRGELGGEQIDALAAAVAGFHASIPQASVTGDHGSPRLIAAQAQENFDELLGFVGEPAQRERILELRRWTVEATLRLDARFAERKALGFVRECHGDLHLGNIVFHRGQPLPFDCIEFSEALRWIDVASEVAFLAMDLFEHRLDGAAWRFLSAYLEITGDYAAIPLLDYYLVYRALVRAKVSLIRAHQRDRDANAAGAIACATSGSAGAGSSALDATRSAGADGGGLSYLALAERFAARRTPSLVVMRGVSGSGKSHLALQLVQHLGGVRLRSDVERKRLHGLAAGANSASVICGGIYGPEANRLTYARLKDLVRVVIGAGYHAIVDASFLQRSQRDDFRELARELEVPFLMVSCAVAADELRRRVVKRRQSGADASEAGIEVLENQLIAEEPLAADEIKDCLIIDTGVDAGSRSLQLQSIASRLPQAV